MSNRIEIIDFMKGLAMILIFSLHSIQFIDYIPRILHNFIMLGQIGVQLFFMCSGFLIEKAAQDNTLFKHGLSKFYLKKYITLALPFITCIFITVVVNSVWEYYGFKVPYDNKIDIFAIGSNILLLHGLFPPYFNNVVGGAWYVGTFFLMLLLLTIILCQSSNTDMRRKYYLYLSLGICLISVILALIFSCIFHYTIDNGSFFYFSFLNQLPALLFGMYTACDSHNLSTKKTLIINIFTLLAAICALFLLKYAVCYALIPLLSSILLHQVFIISEKCVNIKSKISDMIKNIGENTYVIYLFHFFIVWYFPIYLKTKLGINGVMLWFLVLVVGILFFTYSKYVSRIFNYVNKQFLTHLSKG